MRLLTCRAVGSGRSRVDLDTAAAAATAVTATAATAATAEATAATAAAATEPTIDFELDIKVYIDSGQCVLHPNEQKADCDHELRFT